MSDSEVDYEEDSDVFQVRDGRDFSDDEEEREAEEEPGVAEEEGAGGAQQDGLENKEGIAIEEHRVAGRESVVEPSSPPPGFEFVDKAELDYNSKLKHVYCMCFGSSCSASPLTELELLCFSSFFALVAACADVKFSGETADGLYRCYELSIPAASALHYTNSDLVYVIGGGVQRNSEEIQPNHVVDCGEVIVIVGGNQMFAGERYIMVDFGVGGQCKCDSIDSCKCIEMIWLPRSYSKFNDSFTLRPHSPPTRPVTSRDVPDSKIYQVLWALIAKNDWHVKCAKRPEHVKKEEEEKQEDLSEPSAQGVSGATADAPKQKPASTPRRRSARTPAPANRTPEPKPEEPPKDSSRAGGTGSTTTAGGKSSKSKKRRRSSQRVCDSCGESGHLTNRSRRCPEYGEPRQSSSHSPSHSENNKQIQALQERLKVVTEQRDQARNSNNNRQPQSLHFSSSTTPGGFHDLAGFVLRQQTLSVIEKLGVAAALGGNFSQLADVAKTLLGSADLTPNNISTQ